MRRGRRVDLAHLVNCHRNSGYAAWVDDKAGTSIITEPYAKTYQPYLAVRMPVMAFMAVNGVDYPGGNVTLVGRYRGRLSVVVLEVGY